MQDILLTFRPVAIFAGVLLILYSIMSMRGRGYKEKFDAFLEAEHEANSTRKKDIPDSIFYTPDTAFLEEIKLSDEPENQRAMKAIEDLKIKGSKKMLQFEEPLTNTDIKYAYGVANLESIVAYEQNYEKYLRGLNYLAKELIKLHYLSYAEMVLVKALDMEPPFYETYGLIIEVYTENKEKSKLLALKERTNDMKSVSNNSFLNNKINEGIEGALADMDA